MLATDPPGVAATAAVTLNRGGPLGTTISETLLQVTGTGAGAAMSRYAQLPTACRTFSASVGGNDITFTTTPIGLATLGDATVAVRIAASVAGMGVVAVEDVAIVRHGGTLILLVTAGTSIDDGLAVTAERAAYAKIAAAT